MYKSVLPVVAIGGIALLAGCTSGIHPQTERRAGYEQVLVPSALTRARVLCSSLDPRSANTVAGCSSVGMISNQEFAPQKGHEHTAPYSDGAVACGLLRSEFHQPWIVPECFIWRKLPQIAGSGSGSGSIQTGPSRSSAPAEPSVVQAGSSTGNTQTSVSVVRDEKQETVNTSAKAGNVNTSVSRVTDTSTGNQTVVFNEGTANEWSANFDAATGAVTRVVAN